jgi:hypothetical protein
VARSPDKLLKTKLAHVEMTTMGRRKQVTIDGNEAASYVAYRTNEVIAIYPITPSSNMGENSHAWAASGERNIWGVVPAVRKMQSEGGYGRRVRTPWQPTSIFQDSLTCLNYSIPCRVHPCGECFLNELVPLERRAAEVPCHHIPLDAEGATIEEIESEDNQRKLEEAV